MKKKSLFLLVLVSLLAFTLPNASAVPVTFSGGGSSPLSITLPLPVTYEVTLDASGDSNFVFEVPVPAGLFSLSVTGDITFTINSGPAQPISSIQGNASEIQLVSLTPGFMAGDTVILSAGTLTTTFNFIVPAPASGDYNTFIRDAAGNRIATGTVAASVPDSLSTLWLGLPLAGMLAIARLRRFAA